LNPPLLITNDQARQLFLQCQGLSNPPRRKLSNGGLLELITDLGFVQVDSINTVARAHHMILFARNQTYKTKQLTHLLETERSLFEHWTHDASIVPSVFYPYWQHRFDREKVAIIERWRKWRREGFEEICDDILQTVIENGPTMARDIGSRQKKGTGWWDWHPEKTALEYHWRTGALSIAGRAGFQKIYDISENVIPERHRSAHVSIDDFIDWACRSALSRLGVATSSEIANFWDIITKKEAARWCQDQLDDNVLVPVQVEPADKGQPTKALAFAEVSEQISDLISPPKQVRVLSPFDPLIRDRKRCLRLFGFDYRIEVFVPEAKRQYGYYVFPLLQGKRFIGRIDMKHFKNEDALIVKNIWLEPGVKMSKGRQQQIIAELDRHRRFVGAASLITDGVFT
jgi:uncharacterized protein YcaQ